MGGSSWRRDLAQQKLRQQRIDENPPKCAYCGRVIRPPRRYVGNVKYCTEQHAEKAKRERMDERRRARIASVAQAPDTEERAELYPESKIRKGPLLEKIRQTLTPADWDAWVDQGLANTVVAKQVEASVTAVGMARRAAFNERILAIQAASFDPSERHQMMLGPSDSEMAALLAEDPDAFEEKLAALVDAFVAWRSEFFSVGFERAYITKDVHKRWIRATLKTIYTGGRLLILSPPRHGKTDLLIHFCVWLICRNPDIRILWVGPNGDIAENCLGQVRDLLETHETLISAYLPEGQSWAPRSRTGLWQRTKFTVANRGITLKQPTMWCTGVGGKILSIDADFIVVDDPADPDASYTPGGRDKIENWFKVKLITRKMFHTGLAMISSRVHPDDLYSEFVDSDNWEVVVDKAHDTAVCHLDLWDPHPDMTSCVLFPEINPLEYLREQADVVGQALFEMMYLNQPRPDGSLIFDPDVIRANCIDHSRILGTDGIGANFRLVAGLDPAARGVQAAFLWAAVLPSINTDGNRRIPHSTYYMIDMETQKAGGIEGVEWVMRDWHAKYGVTLWVIEDNSYGQGINGFEHPVLRKVVAELGLEIRPTSTGRNKHDKDFGVAAMAPLFHEGHVVLPYGNAEAVRKTEQYIRQLVNFTGDTVATARKHGVNKRASDVLMASWFPHATVIKKWVREERAAKVTVAQASYPEYATPTDYSPFWGQTKYPYS